MTDNFILVPPVRQFNLSGIHIEGCFAIVIDIKVDLVAHFRVQIHPDVLSHIKGRSASCSLRKGRVVCHVPFYPSRYFQRSPGGYPEASTPENLPRGTCWLSHISKRETRSRR